MIKQRHSLKLSENSETAAWDKSHDHISFNVHNLSQMEVIYDHKALNVQSYPCRDSKWCYKNFKDLQDISVFVCLASGYS